MSAVGDVLLAAADRLERTGKHEGWYYDLTQTRQVPRLDRRACALGALLDAAPSDDGFIAARDALRQSVGTRIGEWSDSHSLAEVVAGLRAAAEATA